MNKKKIWLSSPTMHGEEQKYIQEAFDTNWVAPLGKNVDEFEQEVADFVGMKYAAALSSGTAALHLAVKLAGVKAGDIVLCSDLTFAATVNPVSYEKGIQVFIDSERDTWNMDPAVLEQALIKYEGRTKAVIIVNLYGTPAKMKEVMELCNKYHVILIEDAAESFSATYHGRETGTFGTYNCISFNGNKIITTSGGGMLLSNDKAAINKARFWSTQAREPAPWYQHTEVGYNYRMSNIVAGIGRGQLKYLKEHRLRKKIIYDRYKVAFSDLPITMNPYLPYSEPNFWLSCILLDSKVVAKGEVTPEYVRLALKSEAIESRPIWKPMHMQPVYADRDYISTDGANVSEDIFRRGLCLPSDIKMSEEEQMGVIHIIQKVFR